MFSGLKGLLVFSNQALNVAIGVCESSARICLDGPGTGEAVGTSKAGGVRTMMLSEEAGSIYVLVSRDFLGLLVYIHGT